MSALKIVRWLIAILVLGILAYLLSYVFTRVQQSHQVSQATSTPSYLVPLLSAKVAGNDQAALNGYQAIKNNPQSTSEQKAYAAIDIVGVEYGMTGDKSALLQDIQNMKNIILDTTLSAGARAEAMNVLGDMYDESGGDSTVFAAIYKGLPFSSYLVPGNPQLSDMNMEKASYAMFPTSAAAMDVAYIASGQYFFNPNQSASTTAAYVALAEDYLQKADTVVLQEASVNVQFPLSDRYMFYRAWRAGTVGRLAIEAGQPYESQYRQQYDDFFAFAQSKHSDLATNLSLSMRLKYAGILGADKDTAGEKTQLDLLAQALSALPNPKVNSFVLSLKNAHAQPSGGAWTLLTKMFKVSPAFQAAVTKLVS